MNDLSYNSIFKKKIKNNLIYINKYLFKIIIKNNK